MSQLYYTEALYKNRWCEIVSIGEIEQNEINKVERLKVIYNNQELSLSIEEIKDFR